MHALICTPFDEGVSALAAVRERIALYSAILDDFGGKAYKAVAALLTKRVCNHPAQAIRLHSALPADVA